ncbi:MAG: FHA domain-containing protein [Gemmatimonadaceae bacterium]
MEVILEILHPNGTRTLHRVGAGPLTLGRGFSNDVILDDPYVDARHARVALRSEDGGLLLEDLGSVNGFVANAIRRHGSITLHPGDTVRVGRTTLRIHDPHEPVIPALPDKIVGTPPDTVAHPHVRRDSTQRPRWIATNPRSLFIVAAATAAVALNVWLGTADRSSASDVFSITLGLLLIAGGWAAVWAAVGRVLIHRFEYAGHFAIVSAVFLAALAAIVLQEWLNFLFPDSSAVTAVAAFVNVALLAALIAMHLLLSSALPQRRRWQVGLITAVAVLAVGGVFAMADEEPFSDVPAFSSVIKPLAPKWVPTSTVDEFADVQRTLKQEVDAMAAKK